MNNVMKEKFSWFLIAIIGLASCGQDVPDDAAIQTKVYSFDTIGGESRVDLDHTSLKYSWNAEDKTIAWYAPQTSAPEYAYTNIPAPFVAETAGETTRFSLSGHDLTAMGEDPQHYVLMYPWPYAGTAGIDGDEVTYTIGTASGDGYVQGNAFEGIYNLMRAEVDGPSLHVQRPRLTFSNLLTSLRLYVKKTAKPAYDNIQITGMEILFPENVTGVTKVNYRTGGVASASSRKVIVNLENPLTPQDSYLDGNGQAQDDQYALVVVKPFTLKANSDNNTTDRIVVTLSGTGKDIYTGETKSISQSIVVKTNQDASFTAGHFRAIGLKLTNEWTVPVAIDLVSEFAPEGDYGSGVTLHYEKRGSCVGFHALVRTDDEGADMVVLDNTANRSSLGNTGLSKYGQSAFYLSKSDVLPGYTAGNKVVVSFDAACLMSYDSGNIPIWIGENRITLSGESGSKTNASTGDSGRSALKEVVIAPAAYSRKTVPSGYPTTVTWNHYTVVLENGFPESDHTYAGFILPGTLRNPSGDKAIVYIKNISFASKAN